MSKTKLNDGLTKQQRYYKNHLKKYKVETPCPKCRGHGTVMMFPKVKGDSG